MKKLLSLVLTFVIVMSLATVALADAQADLNAVGISGTVTLTGDCAQLKLKANIGDRTGGTGTIGDPYLVSRVIDELEITGAYEVEGFDVSTDLRTIYPDSAPAYYIVQSYEIGTLTFSDMTFTNVACFFNMGNLAIDNLVFENVTFDMEGKTIDAAAHIISKDGGIENVTFDNCKFLNCSGVAKPIAIDCRSEDDINITITGCEFDGAAANAVQISGSGSVFTGNIEISNNEISNTADRALRISDVGAGADIVVEDNTFTGNVTDGDNQVLKFSSVDEGANITATELPAGTDTAIGDTIAFTGDFANLTMEGGKIAGGTFETLPAEEFLADSNTVTQGTPSSGNDSDNETEERESNEPTPAEIERDRVVAAIESAEDGDTVKLNTKDAITVSRFIADAMSGKNVNLEYPLGEETVTVNGKSVPKSPAYRVWYSLELFAKFA